MTNKHKHRSPSSKKGRQKWRDKNNNNLAQLRAQLTWEINQQKLIEEYENK